LNQSLDRDMPLWFMRGFAGVLSNTMVNDDHVLLGAPIPWELVRRAASRRPIILSAGLTPDNVRTAVRLARPFAVDVNSGVEARPGKKDPEKVQRFIDAAKAAIEDAP